MEQDKRMTEFFSYLAEHWARAHECAQDKAFSQLFSDFYKLPVDKRNEMKLRLIHVASDFAIKGEQ